jgi:hypothetical protein
MSPEEIIALDFFFPCVASQDFLCFKINLKKKKKERKKKATMHGF